MSLPALPAGGGKNATGWSEIPLFTEISCQREEASMTVANNPVSLKFLEGVCLELRAQMEARREPPPRRIEYRNPFRTIASTAVFDATGG